MSRKATDTSLSQTKNQGNKKKYIGNDRISESSSVVCTCPCIDSEGNEPIRVRDGKFRHKGNCSTRNACIKGYKWVNKQ